MTGWVTKSIGEVTTIINGGTPKSGVAEYWDGDVLWITPKDMGKLDCSYVADTSRKISAKGLAKSSAKLIPENSVILSTRAPIGHLVINTHPMATNQGCRGLVPSEALVTEYLFYFLRLNVGLLNDLGSGTTFKELSKGALSGVQIPLPPLPEQKRIVAILDEAFAGIDAAVANTEKNLANARELFESTLNAVFTQKGDGWVEKPLGETCVLQRGFDLPKRLRSPGEYPLVSSSGVIDCHTEARVLAPGVATGRSGSIGNVFFIEEDFWPLNTVLYIKEFFGNDPQFIYHLLKKFDLKQYASGAGVPTLNRNHVHSEMVCIPESISEQRRIVGSLNSLWDETQRLESLYQQKFAALAELKQSILQKAFAGELTAKQDKAVAGAVA